MFKFESPQTIGIIGSSGLPGTLLLEQLQSEDPCLSRNLISFAWPISKY